MQGIFTKITIGFLVLALVIGTGVTFLVNTANLNGITPDQILSDNQYAQNAQEAQRVIYSAKNASDEAGIDSADISDIGAARDSLTAADEQIKISTVVFGFFDDLSNIIPIDNFLIQIIFAIIVTIGVSAGIFLLFGRNI